MLSINDRSSVAYQSRVSFAGVIIYIWGYRFLLPWRPSRKESVLLAFPPTGFYDELYFESPVPDDSGVAVFYRRAVFAVCRAPPPPRQDAAGEAAPSPGSVSPRLEFNKLSSSRSSSSAGGEEAGRLLMFNLRKKAAVVKHPRGMRDVSGREGSRDIQIL